jgi:hypothetical protein
MSVSSLSCSISLLLFLTLLVTPFTAAASFSCACSCCSSGMSGGGACAVVPSFVGFASRSTAQCTGIRGPDDLYCTKICQATYSSCPNYGMIGGCLALGSSEEEESISYELTPPVIATPLLFPSSSIFSPSDSSKLVPSSFLVSSEFSLPHLNSTDLVCLCLCLSLSINQTNLIGYATPDPHHLDPYKQPTCNRPCIPVYAANGSCSGESIDPMIQTPCPSAAECSTPKQVYMNNMQFTTDGATRTAEFTCLNGVYTSTDTVDVNVNTTLFAEIGLQPPQLQWLMTAGRNCEAGMMRIQSFINGMPPFGHSLNTAWDPDSPFLPLYVTDFQPFADKCGDVLFTFQMSCVNNGPGQIALGGIHFPYVPCE